MNMQSPLNSRSVTKSLRIDASRNALIEQAALSAGTTFTSFVLDAAAAKAEAYLLEKRLFVVDSAVFTDIEELLCADRAANPKLKALFDAFGSELHDDAATPTFAG